jgi:hypothetical protein
MLKTPLPPLNDADGKYLPDSGFLVVDAHVHLFFAVWSWFEKFRILQYRQITAIG